MWTAACQIRGAVISQQKTSVAVELEKPSGVVLVDPLLVLDGRRDVVDDSDGLSYNARSQAVLRGSTRYRGLIATLRNLITPAPCCSENGPFLNSPFL